ncbi:MAG: penicillin-binding transpeptidase domain-containing protein [Dehalococcoidia bacterium]
MLPEDVFEGRVRVAGAAALAGILAVFATLSYWQLFRTDLATHDDNPRVLAAFSNPHRGRILDRDGNVLVESLADGTRHYRDASVAHAVGYIDARYGSQGAELAFNSELAGESGAGWRGAVDAELRRTAIRGADVRLTLDARVQAAAATALGARPGAIVAIDPRNGEVLAMVSVPTYDPGSLATAGEALLKDPSSPLLNRATQGLYTPGSTFKTVTAASALENKVIQPTTTVNCPGEIVIDGFHINCANTAQGVGTYPFSAAFTYSVNAIFANLGVSLGWDRLLATAGKLGFGESIPFALDTAPSIVVPAGTERTKVLLASTAFGQGEILATPLQMALIAATIANQGVLVEPRLGLSASFDGETRAIDESVSRRVLDSSVAATLRDLMVSVVANGQARGANLPGITVGGKTGTAETGRDGKSHAWFIAFAPAENPTIAVAVIVEDGGRGGEVASPIAGQVLSAALRR